MTTQLRINMIDIKDYLSMREKGLPTKVKWENVRNLNLPNGKTFIQTLAEDEGYTPFYEPSLKNLRETVEKLLK